METLKQPTVFTFKLASIKMHRLSSINEVDEDEPTPVRKQPRYTIKRSDTSNSPARIVPPEEEPILESYEELGLASSPNLRKFKRANSLKSSGAMYSEFPVLVRGIDIENTQSKLHALVSKDKPLDNPSEFDQGSPLLKETVEFIDSDRSQEDLGPDDSPLSGNSQYNVQFLQRLLTEQSALLPPQQLLEHAVLEQAPDAPRDGFWAKVFNERKKHADLMERACDQWHHTEVEAKERSGFLQQVKSEVEKLGNIRRQQTEEYRQLRHSISQTLSGITEEKKSGMSQFEELSDAIEVARLTNDRLVKEREQTRSNCTKALELTKEREERYRMNIEDHCSTLTSLTARRDSALAQVQARQRNLDALEQERQTHDGLKQKVSTALHTLNQVLSYFEQSSGNAEVHQAFIQALCQLKSSSQAALAAEEEFAAQATTDPRDIIYYSRGGKHAKPSR